MKETRGRLETWVAVEDRSEREIAGGTKQKNKKYICARRNLEMAIESLGMRCSTSNFVLHC